MIRSQGIIPLLAKFKSKACRMRLYNDKYTIVTGGSGFIGSCLLKELNQRGVDKIVVVDDLGSDERWMNLRGKKFLEYLHRDQLLPWLEGRESEIECIFHLGACSDTTERNADFLMENNYRYTRSLIEYSLKNDIRILIASSAATYGDGRQGFSDDHSLLESLCPLNMYGFSKHLVDLWLHREGLLGRVTSVKYFNVFGPNEWHKGRMASRILTMVSQVKESGVIELFKSHHPDYKDGEQKRDFIYVKDAVSITCDLLEKSAFGIFNIGSGVASSWNQLAQAVFKAMKVPAKIEYIPMPEDLQGKYQYFTKAEAEKLKRALGKRNDHCRYDLDRAVEDYVQNYILTGERW